MYLCTYHTTHNIHHPTPPPSRQPLRTSHHIIPYRPQPSSIHTLPFPILPQSTIATMPHCHCLFCGHNFFSLPRHLGHGCIAFQHLQWEKKKKWSPLFDVSPKSRFQSICREGHQWPLEKEAITNAGRRKKCGRHDYDM